MTDRRAWVLARALFALTMVSLVGGSIALAALTARGAYTWGETASNITFNAAMCSFSIVGVIVARRQPRNPVSWVLLGVGFVWALDLPFKTYIDRAIRDPELFASATYVAALNSALWAPGLAPLGTFLLLYFPDGRLPTPSWRWWARLSGAVLVVATVGMWLIPGPIEAFTPTTSNPFGLQWLEPYKELVYVPILMIPLTMAGSAVALIRRYRRARGVERLQMKWLTTTAALVAVIYLVTMLASIPYDWVGGGPTWVGLLQNFSLFTFMLLPVAVGVAITRYRLYDIDRLINRALVYGVVSAVLITVYVLGVVGAGAAMRAVTGSEQGNLAVAGSTLAVAALFRPFRARVQGFIDRRFYRGKYNAAVTVEAFSARLRQETDLARLTQGLHDVVTETVQPARVSLWIARG